MKVQAERIGKGLWAEELADFRGSGNFSKVSVAMEG